jgi:hypothetical protein
MECGRPPNPMASDVSRGNLAKLVAQDFAMEGAITKVLENTRVIAEAARRPTSHRRCSMPAMRFMPRPRRLVLGTSI